MRVVQELPIGDTRWQLYRLLSDPTRLRLLALAAAEELSVGELAELLNEPQPNVSRHASPLRQAGLLSTRKQGTRTLVRLAEGAARDTVVADALGAGRRLCGQDGSLARVADVVQRRDARTREFFSRPGKPEQAPGIAGAMPAYLSAFASLIEPRELAVDVGTGDGALLDLLAPVFRRVVAIDRSDAQLGRALHRMRARGYSNVELVAAPIGSKKCRDAVGPGADLVMAVRVLHHAPLPREAMRGLVELARPGGRVLVIDYARHDDERMREAQADVWMGFEDSELSSYARDAQLEDIMISPLPAALCRSEPDGHVTWLALSGRAPRLEKTREQERQ